MDDFDKLNEEKGSGWTHIASLMDELIRHCGFNQNEALVYIDQLPIIENRKPLKCSICFDDTPVGNGLILKDCLHMFCKGCLAGHIAATDTAEVKCPFVDGDHRCKEVLKPLEIKALVGQVEYDRHFNDLALREAQKTLGDVFHCLTPDCPGFCVVDDEADAHLFECPLCLARNCVVCKIIHEGTCDEFWQALEDEEEDENNRVAQMQNEERSLMFINAKLKKKVWRRCPRCKAAIEKNGGCLHMICRNCDHDFNWTGK